MFPFHTWLPDAHVEAPTGGLGRSWPACCSRWAATAFLRLAIPLFPVRRRALRADPDRRPQRWWASCTGPSSRWVQTDLKKLVAYSSVAHLGFVMLGLDRRHRHRLAVAGRRCIQMLSHGISTGALFLLVGMLYERRHTREIADFGGLKPSVMPLLRGGVPGLVVPLASMADCPGFNGFVGEFLILVGSYQSGLLFPTMVATFGVVLAAIYLLKALHESLWGPITHDENRDLEDLSKREILTLTPLCILMLAIGVAPNAFLQPSKADLERVLSTYQARLARPVVTAPSLDRVMLADEDPSQPELMETEPGL